MAVHLGEEAAQSLRRHVQFDVVHVDARAGPVQGGVVDVGGQDLDGGVEIAFAEEFQQADGQRIDLFAGGAACHPDADGDVGRAVLDEGGEDDALERLESFLVAEEACDADEQVLVEVLRLGVVFPQLVEVFGRRLQAAQGHAPADAADDGGALVLREIDAGVAAEDAEDLVHDAVGHRGEGGVLLGGVGMAGEPHQLAGDLVGRQDVIDPAVGDGASRHGVVAGRFFVLGEGDAALGLDGLEAEGAVGAAAGQDHADGASLLVVGQGAEHVVDGHVRPPGADARRQDDAAVMDGQIGVGRDQVDVAGQEAHPGLGLGHGQRRDPRQQFGQEALVSRRQVLHEEEGDVVLGRDVFEDFAEGFQAAGRAADADHEHGHGR